MEKRKKDNKAIEMCISYLNIELLLHTSFIHIRGFKLYTRASKQCKVKEKKYR